MTTTTATAAAAQALADTQQQAHLVSQQLQAVGEALATATIGTDQHVAMARRAATLRSQLDGLEASIATLTESAKTEQEKQEEATRQAAQEAADLAARMASHRATVESTITAINAASDHLAALLAQAAEELLPLLQELEQSSGYRGSGWESILPLPFSGNGRIGPLAYVITTPNGSRMATRYDARKHLG